jgi:hypothetical protein
MGIFPINIPIADTTMIYATAQPLARWQDGDVTRLVMVSLPRIKTRFCFTGVKESMVEGGSVHRDGDSWLIAPKNNDVLRFKSRFLFSLNRTVLTPGKSK